MKKILIALLVLCSGVASAQIPYYTNISARYKWIAGTFDSTFHVPTFATTPTLRYRGNQASGALGMDTVLHRLQFYSDGWRETGMGFSDGVTVLGYQAYNQNPAGTITAIGYKAGFSLTAGARNTIIGYEAMTLATSGLDNTVLGYEAMEDAIDAGNNTAIGSRALRNCTSCDFNTAVGQQAMDAVTTGFDNTAFGYQSLERNLTGLSNTAIGTDALSFATGDANTALGSSVGTGLTTGSSNILIGRSTANNLGSGSNNVFLGLGINPGAVNNTMIFAANGERFRVDSVGNFGIGTTSPSVSALLDVSSTTKGFLAPRMTEAQRDLITTPPTGLLIYQTDATPGFRYYSGAAWTAIGGGGSGITIGTTTITSGTDTRVLYDDGGVVGEDAGFTFNETTNDLTITGDVKPTSLYLPTTTAFDAGKPGRIYNGSLTSLSIIGTAQAVQELGLYSANGTNGLSIKTSAAIVVIAPSGKLAVGADFTPTALLHIAAGTASANTAPYKYASGALNSTAEVGAKEFLTDKEYLTITTGAARKEITLNDAALTPGVTPVATTNGRLTDGVILASGTYTPTLTNTTNITASTPYVWQYLRVGDVVHVSGKVDIDPTGTGAVELRFDIPIASALAFDYELAGTANSGAVAGESASVSAVAATDGGAIKFIAVDLTNKSYFITYTYKFNLP